MYIIGVLLTVLAYSRFTTASTCDACKTTYTTEKVAAGADNTAKCTALKNYLKCLDTSTVTDSGCPLVTADALGIESDFAAANCATSFSDTCVCQKDFWKTDQSANNAAICSAGKKYVACLKGKMNPGCDGVSSVVTLATNIETRMNALGNTDCSLAATTCYCDIQYTKSSISSDVLKCSALRNYISCLVGKTGTGCDGTTAQHTLATSASTTLSGISPCNITKTCACELDYTKTQITTANNCSEYKKLTTCIQNSVEPGCDPKVTRTAVGNIISGAITNLGTTCPVTKGCQCQIDFAKAEISDSTKCSRAQDLLTCLEGAASSETVCDGVTTRTKLVDSLNQPGSITNQLCSNCPGLVVASHLMLLTMGLTWLYQIEL